MGPPPFGSGNVLGRIGVGHGASVASMGPPPFSSGNSAVGSGTITIRATLQWGHRLSAVETRDTRPSPSHAGRASMGPPPFGSGNKVPTNGTVTSGIRLQWGHRLSAVETLECLAGELEGLMMLQWGHRLSAVETPAVWLVFAGRCSSFNGATAFRQWKQPSRHKHRRRPQPSFNGATAFRQWKRAVLLLHLAKVVHASMGPPPFGSGNFKRRRDAPAPLFGASMGPPPFGSRNV